MALREQAIFMTLQKLTLAAHLLKCGANLSGNSESILRMAQHVQNKRNV